jgi:hypothetical protein
MTSDKVPFFLGISEQNAFDQTQEALTTAPVLMPPDPRASSSVLMLLASPLVEFSHKIKMEEQ